MTSSPHNLILFDRKEHLPYIQGVSDRFAKFLRKNNIYNVFKHVHSIRQRVKSVKD